MSEQYDEIAGIKTGHGKVPGFLWPVYIGLLVWAVYYTFTAGAYVTRDVAAEMTNAKSIYLNKCIACHMVGTEIPGGVIGPDLAGVGTRMTEEQIRVFLQNPVAARPDKPNAVLMLPTAQALTQVELDTLVKDLVNR